MKTTGIFFVFVFCMTSSLIASLFDTDINLKSIEIVNKIKRTLYNFSEGTTFISKDKNLGSTVPARYENTYISNDLPPDKIKKAFDDLDIDFRKALNNERLNS